MKWEACLADLDARLDPAVEEELSAAWRTFAAGEFTGALFTPERPAKAPPGVEWPKVGVNEALGDFDLMALQQFGQVSDLLAAGQGLLPSVRANYGSSILPLLFGVEPFVMDPAMDTLPTSRPVAGGLDGIRRLVERGVPDLEAGYGARVFEMGRRFMAIQARYPRIGRFVRVYHPDIQGAMDACEVLWGSNLFLDILDVADLAHAFLNLLCETYIAFLRRWETIVPFDPEFNVHWSALHRGKIMLRLDSAMNFSPAMFEEFIEPCEQKLLDAFGGGAIHFCGRGDHYIHRLPEMRGVSAVAMSQPHLNDMETIYRHTVDRGIQLVRFSRQVAEAALAVGRDLHGNVQC